MTERRFQEAVVDLAHMLGWTVSHFRAARTSKGWRTPVAVDGAGWPDLLMVRRDRILAAELKGEKGRVTPEQRDWLERLDEAGVETYLWRAGVDSFEAIAQVLR
jgi:hypothetical protein